MKDLRVVSVQIRNVLGIEERAIAPDGRAVLVRGRNESGKTSLIRAVEATLSGGSLAKLQRVGSEEDPEVVLVLDGPGGHFRVVKRGNDTVKVAARVGDSAAFEDVPRPQEFLTHLFDPVGANPVRFLMAADKDRARLLLEALDLKMDRAELLAEMKIGTEELPPIPVGLHPLEEIALIRDAVFRTRTGVNRDQKSASQAADQLRRNTPAVLPDDPGGEAQGRLELAAMDLAQEVAREEAEAAAAERSALEAASAAAKEVELEVEGFFKAAAAKLRQAHDQDAAAIRAEAEKRIAGLATVTQTTIDGLREAGETRLEDAEAVREKANAEAAAARALALEAIAVKRGELTAARERLATLREQRETSAKARALEAQTKEFDDQAAKLKVEGDRLTAAIEALDLYARRLAESLPIPGLSIEGKEIRRHGIPYDQLNQAQRVEIAAKVAELRAEANPLKVLFLDGLETLDTAHRTALLDHLVARGIQPFGAVVTDEDVEVTYVGAVQAEGVEAR
jgi:hypothetical protein